MIKRNKYKNKSFLYLLMLSLLLGSCNMLKPYQKPEINTQGLYGAIQFSDSNGIAALSWKELFTDPLLQNLIEQGIEQNLDLKIAYTRVMAAEAYLQQSRAALFPNLNANLNARNDFSSSGNNAILNNASSNYQIGLSSNWEVDLWGKWGSNKRANFAYFLQSEAAARTVQSTLVSKIASYYYALLAYDQGLSITEQTIGNWDTTVATMRALKDAAIVTEAAVVQSEAQRYAVMVTLPNLKQQIRETENAISMLLGIEPQTIKRSVLEAQQSFPLMETGVPVRLLSNRPDVQQAELGYRASFELTNMARTYFYPSLTISGSAGLNSASLDKLINPVAIVASIGGGLFQPILDRRANKTRLEVAKAEQEQAYLMYKASLLNAGTEVSNALFRNQNAVIKLGIRKAQIGVLEKAVDYSSELLQNGFANYTEVIDARQSLLQAELNFVNDNLQKLQSMVDLYKALGGGWR